MNQNNIKLYSSIKPELKSGDYTITVTKQEISGGNNVDGKKEFNEELEKNKTSKSFKVLGEKFSINGSHIASVYPGRNAVGDFTEELPYITFYRESLPWIRNAYGVNNSWMALVLLHIPNDVEKQNWKVESKKIIDHLPVAMQQDKELGKESKEGSCRIITIKDSNAFLNETGILLGIDNKRLTTKEAFLNSSSFCHVREIDVQSSQISPLYKKDVLQEGKKKKSIVVSHRSFAKEGKYEAHLISLEQKINLNEIIEQNKPLELISLYSWAFEHNTKGPDSFKKLGETLFNKGGLLVDEEIMKSPASGENMTMQRKITSALSPKNHKIDLKTESLRPNDFYLQNLEEKFSKEPEKVHSYLIAWELGRMMALSDKRFLTAKQILKNTHYQSLLNTLHLSNSNHAHIRNIANENTLNFKEKVKIDAHKHQLAQSSAKNIVANKLVSNLLTTNTKVRKTLQNIKDQVKDNYDSNKQLQGSVNQDQHPHEFYSVSDFIADIHLLKNIPFPYLILDKTVLPENTLKFFYVDPNWIDCVIKGAFSIGYHPVVHEHFMDTHFDSLKNDGKNRAIRYRKDTLKIDHQHTLDSDLCGFIIRSKIVTFFPHIQIKGYNISETEMQKSNSTNSQVIDPIHIEQKGADILLVLFNEVPKSIRILEPDHGLRFKEKNDTIYKNNSVLKNSAEIAKMLTEKRQYIGL